MNSRFNFQKAEPQAYKAMGALETYLAGTTIKPLHKELIKMRASLINKCAFCIDMHTRDARKLGETEQRIYMLSAWRETNLFSEEEQVLLAMTEEVTLVHEHGLSETTYQKARALFDEQYISQVIMAIITINAWNRIAISTESGFTVSAR